MSQRRWIAVANGALDLSETEHSLPAEILVIPILPSPVIGMNAVASSLWRRMVISGISEESISDSEKEMIEEFVSLGIASEDSYHPSRVNSITSPWLDSPLHELVYALLSSLIHQKGIRGLFIKGPILESQGLRKRRHSGDVDLWVSPDNISELKDILSEWGWKTKPDIWDGTTVNHSVTLIPLEWGCEIDIHRKFPGFSDRKESSLQEIYDKSVSFKFASVSVRVPSKVDNSIIYALHQLRPEVGRKLEKNNILNAANILEIAGRDSYWRSIEIGAFQPLQEAFKVAFPDLHTRQERTKEFDWGWRNSSSHVVAYCRAVSELPILERMHILFRLVWPAADVIRASEAATSTKSKTVFVARIRRFERGFIEFIKNRR